MHKYAPKIRKFADNFSSWSWWKNKVDFQDTRWYVWIALVASIIQIYSVIQTRQDVKEIKDSIQWVYNIQQVWFTEDMSGKDVINTYFELLSKQDYQSSCSMETKKRCQQTNSEQLAQYAIDKKRVWFAKYEDGEHLRDIWKAKIQPENDMLETWCVKVNFRIKWEDSDIEQIHRYDILTRPNDQKEISSVLCEKAFKNWQDRTTQMKCGQSDVCSK
jgi:hypothetical protein